MTKQQRVLRTTSGIYLLLAVLFSGHYFSEYAAAAEAVIAADAVPERLLAESAGEGPAWHSSWGLLFSGDGHTMRYDHQGRLTVFRKDAGSNGLLFDPQGRLLTCESRRRRVTRRGLDGSLEVLADSFAGQPFNNPNDITIDSHGRIYFSDPRYGDRSDMALVDSAGRHVEGVYRIDPDGRVARIITHQVDRPNGVLVTPDDRFLYVADNNNNTVDGPRKLWRFDLQGDGTVDEDSSRMIYDWGRSRGPDGMALDRLGRLYVAGGRNQSNRFETVEKKGGVYVFSEDGELLTFIPIGHDEVTNCAFGGADGKSLFITAGGTLWRIRTMVAGADFPGP